MVVCVGAVVHVILVKQNVWSRNDNFVSADIIGSEFNESEKSR